MIIYKLTVDGFKEHLKRGESVVIYPMMKSHNGVVEITDGKVTDYVLFDDLDMITEVTSKTE